MTVAHPWADANKLIALTAPSEKKQKTRIYGRREPSAVPEPDAERFDLPPPRISAGREAPRWRKEVGLALHLLTATGAAFALLALIAAAQADWRWRHPQARLLGHPGAVTGDK
jgi:hypothetical protein